MVADLAKVTFVWSEDKRVVHLSSDSVTALCGKTCLEQVSTTELNKTTINCSKCWQQFLAINPALENKCQV